MELRATLNEQLTPQLDPQLDPQQEPQVDSPVVDLSALDLVPTEPETSPEPIATTVIDVPATPAPATRGFAAFGFAPELLEALEAIGYQEPSPI